MERAKLKLFGDWSIFEGRWKYFLLQALAKCFLWIIASLKLALLLLAGMRWGWGDNDYKDRKHLLPILTSSELWLLHLFSASHSNCTRVTNFTVIPLHTHTTCSELILTSLHANTKSTPRPGLEWVCRGLWHSKCYFDRILSFKMLCEMDLHSDQWDISYTEAMRPWHLQVN